MSSLSMVVKILKYPKLLTVPLHYIYKFDVAKSLNNRINRNQKHLCFWSDDHQKVPNFDLPIAKRFVRAQDSCFEVNLVKVFGKCKLKLN